MIYCLIHHPDEALGIISESLKELHLPYREIHLYEGDGFPRETSDLTGLIIMGGHMNVDDLSNYPYLLPEVRLIETVLRDQKPVLGICLGAQLMAKALGAKVYPHNIKEVGWAPIRLTEEGQLDRIFKDEPAVLPAFHWHGDTYDLPNDAVNLAHSDKCTQQAFRWGNHAYGFQFHLEATSPMIRNWITAKENQSLLIEAGIQRDDLLSATEEMEHLQSGRSRRIFHRLLQQIFIPTVLSRN